MQIVEQGLAVGSEPKMSKAVRKGYDTSGRWKADGVHSSHNCIHAWINCRPQGGWAHALVDLWLEQVATVAALIAEVRLLAKQLGLVPPEFLVV
jgi:hypothetical protein